VEVAVDVGIAIYVGAKIGIAVHEGVKNGTITIPIIHLSQHGEGNKADTGIEQEVQQMVQDGLAATMCDALAKLLAAAKASGNSQRIRRIQTTQKAYGCRGSRQSR
jgi:hypothetical protein